MVQGNDSEGLLKRRKAHCDFLLKKPFRCNAEVSRVAIALYDLLATLTTDVRNYFVQRLTSHPYIARIPRRKYSAGQKCAHDFDIIFRSPSQKTSYDFSFLEPRRIGD